MNVYFLRFPVFTIIVGNVLNKVSKVNSYIITFFYYDQLQLYNYRTKGRIAPDNYNTTTQKVETPTVPAGARPGWGTFVTLNSKVTPGRIGVYNGKQKSFHLCEVDNKNRPSGGNALDDLCLIMFVKAYGPPKPNAEGHGYYRLDFKDYGSGMPIDILRNHDYQIKVESVEGWPAPTPEEAFNGNHTLKCRIVPWNKVNENVEVDGTKRLKVDTRSILLKGASATTGKTLTVTTENTKGWTVTDVPSWLTVSPTSSTSDGVAGITVKAAGPVGFHSGSFKLKAGNAEMVINVNQAGKLPLEYVAEYNLAGGKQYGYRPNNAPQTSAQSDDALRWATSHDNNQSGYYNWYVCTGVSHGIYNPRGSKNIFLDDFFKPGHPGHGYHLPSRWELASVFPYNQKVNFGRPINHSNINEAIEFGRIRIRGTFANDYFSTGNNVCYALRFKQGTRSSFDNESHISYYPLAADNSMLCAYRYTRVGSFFNDNNLTSHLKIDCVYLGAAGASMPISTISNDAWWDAHSAEVITRIFPAAGQIYPASSSGWGPLSRRGDNGNYWTRTIGGSFPWSSILSSSYITTYFNHTADGDHGYSVRLFANE